jgi:hypothetical protein
VGERDDSSAIAHSGSIADIDASAKMKITEERMTIPTTGVFLLEANTLYSIRRAGSFEPTGNLESGLLGRWKRVVLDLFAQGLFF